jgi:hypothetical protein
MEAPHFHFDSPASGFQQVGEKGYLSCWGSEVSPDFLLRTIKKQILRFAQDDMLRASSAASYV